MSADSLAHESRDDGPTTQANHGKAGEDVENTPTSEAPPSVNVITPSAGEAMASASQSQSAASADYFALHPAPSTTTALTALDQQQAQPLSQQPLAHPNAQLSRARARTPQSNPSPAASVTGSDGSAPRPHSESAAVNPSSLLHISPRPTPQTAISSLSIESTESSATVRPNRPALTTQLTFPSQALAELHKQKYPASYVPSYMRGGPHVNTFSAAIASHYGRRGIQTSHNSPAVTPSTAGLFDPAGPASAVPFETESDASGTYASPFLHFTHAIAPKETHTADVDFDPVSGRKVINNYEIVDELGRGTHGKVKLGRDLYDERKYVAIKIVERFSKRRKLGRLGTTEDKVKKEVAILKKARHPNVVALLEVIDDPSRKKVYIVLEWVEQGEIRWRTKGPKEIAMVEARRYEREKSGLLDERKAAEDRAVLDEAKKRLETKKQERLRAARRSRRAARNNPAAWSIEMTGDDDSSDSDDALSRISSVSHGPRELDVVTSSQQQQWLDPGLGRRPSRTPTPLQPALDTAIAHPSRFLKLTAEPETLSPISSDPTPLSAALQSSIDHLTGLEGTMYGAYDPVYGASMRIASLPSSLRGSQHGSSEGLAALADELLDSELDSDLEHVPVMTMEQIRVAFRDTLLGLQYLHYQGIIHRDIKPPNLLSTSLGRVKISDFGVSYLGRPVADGEGEDVSEAEAHDLGDEAKELAKTVGTPAFYAPELCSTDPADEPLPVTKAIDVWALGITLFCMLFARTPFVDDQYVVMRQIADEEVFIPRQRLQPVEFDSKSRSSSRASSRARHSLHPPATKRMDLDFAYENLGDELHDLLTRLLIKDPRSRITLEEVRHHPWVLADLPEREQWLEETDPTRQAEKKIEISKDEINTAVVPLNLMERIKSVAKGVGTKLGLGTRRERSQSSASQSKDGSPGPSAHSSSSTISQDARRMSIRPDQIVSALQSSHDQHPLAKSVAASPESGKASGRMSRLNGHSDAGHRLTRVPSRPTPNRAMTVASTTESMRTVTQSDFVPRGAKDESPPPSPGLPGTPTALASQGGSALGGLLGGAARMVNRVRESSRQRSRQRRGPTSETGSVHSSDPHAEASIAVSDATAAGHVHQPETLRGECTPNSSVHNSPASSRPQSVTSDHQHLHPSPVEPGLLSRMSSTSSVASRGRRERYREYKDRPASRSRRAHGAHESTAEQWQRADEERIRKLVREHKEETERANSARSSPYFGTPPDLFPITRTCPTSPDDDIAKRQDSQAPSVADMSYSDTPEESVSPTHHTGQLPPALLSSSSDLGSAVSMSISNPSIPSVISEASSISPSMHGDIYDDVKGQPSSDDTLNPAPGSQEDFGDDINGYSPDQEEAAINSDGDEDFDSSSDSDGGLVMSRRKSAAKHGGHGVAAPLGVHKERRGTGLSTRSKKSSRSGSNNTMKKVRTRESGDEQSRRSLDIREE